MAQDAGTTKGQPRRHLRWPVRRYREIAEVLFRHGMGFVAQALGFGRLVPLRFRRGKRALPLPAHVRATIEDLGTTFIKIGQILSTRTDILPPEYAKELERLQDHVAPMPAAAIRAVIEEDLGKPVGRLFAAFEDSPRASASIGQVHRAALPSGEHVVVKVQKPGVAERVEADLRILHHLSRLSAAQSLVGNMVDLPELVDEFSWVLRNELDYRREGRNAQRMARNFAANRSLRVPHIYDVYTTRRVLVMEELHGVRIDELGALDRGGIDRRALARRSSQILLQSIFEFGFYHADPHPGNFLVLPDGALAAIDFGMVGALDPSTRRQLLQLVLAVVEGDAAAAVEALQGFGIAQVTVDQTTLRRELDHVLEEVSGRRLGEILLAPLIGELFSLVRRHHMRLPPELALLLKTLAMNEGVGRKVDPDFVATEEVGTYLRDLALKEVVSPEALGRLLRSGAKTMGVISRLPRQLERALLVAERGDLRWGLNQGTMDRVARLWNAALNRLALAILFAGLAVTAAVLWSGHPAGVVRVIVDGGLGVAGALCLLVLVLVWRAR